MLSWRIHDTGRSRYAVLFCVYGGPRAQMVDVQYSRDSYDWHNYERAHLLLAKLTVPVRLQGTVTQILQSLTAHVRVNRTHTACMPHYNSRVSLTWTDSSYRKKVVSILACQ